MACAGKFLILSNLFAPKCCDTMEDIALLVCPKTQISIEINVPTIPTAAKDSVALPSMLPIIAVSVIDKIGSAIPAINAGTANLLMCLKLMFVFTEVCWFSYIYHAILFLHLHESFLMFTFVSLKQQI